jgi:long-subunit acyl-CoA synthetase (AMP-forming)
VTDGCYDAIVFKKMQELLDGNVNFMITASAPIEPDVMKLLRICFCCTFIEVYGLTETSDRASVSHSNDPAVGHV